MKIERDTVKTVSLTIVSKRSITGFSGERLALHCLWYTSGQ